MSTEQTIGGYRQLNLMMTGQTSQVWEVTEGSSGRHFALKLLLPETSREAEHRNFLYHEAAVGMSLHHPNVIKILKLVKDKHNPYIIMEFFPGGNLKLRMMRKQEFVVEKAHRIITQAASGLAALNEKGWVHRDIKPDNILVNSAGEVRLIDFALAQRISKKGLFGWFKRKPKTSGTRSYMSPEQIRGEPLDQRADVYSFGATMYEIVTGRPPYRGLSPSDLLNKHLTEKPVPPQVYNPKVTDECSRIILQMISKKPEDRPKNMIVFMSQFRSMRVFQGDKAERTEQ